jgi:predicted Rossmann-fold nucleotide-binding protein
MKNMTKVAVIGNKNWQNRRKVQEILQGLKSKFDEVIIVGAGGNEGANSMIRKYALEFGMNYIEYNPSYSGYNLYSAMPKTYYGKSYHFSQLHHRMKLIAQNCDYMIIMTNESTMDPFLKTAYSNINKQNKPVVLLG